MFHLIFLILLLSGEESCDEDHHVILMMMIREEDDVNCISHDYTIQLLKLKKVSLCSERNKVTSLSLMLMLMLVREVEL